MKRTVLLFITLFLLAGCGGIKITKPMLKMILSSSIKVSDELFYADSCDKRIGIPYVENGEPGQVLDIYYANGENRKDAVLIDIHNLPQNCSKFRYAISRYRYS